jgi:hypothetical protein
MNAWLRRYLAVGGVIAVLSNVAKTHLSQTEMALWTIGMALVAVVLWRGSGKPTRPIPRPIAGSYIPDSDYLPPSKVRRPWSGRHASREVRTATSRPLVLRPPR